MASNRNKFKLFIDRALSQSIWKQILILVGFLAILLVLSYIMLACSKQAWTSFCDDHGYKLKFWLLPVYLLIDTNALNTIYMSGASGWLLFFCSIIYVLGLLVCSGMLIGVITNYIGLRVQNHRDGLVHYVKSGHYIIMGYDDMVPSIVKDIFNKKPKTNVVIVTSYDAKSVNEKLRRSEVRDKINQIFVTYGHRTVKDYYKNIHLEDAEEIFVVGNRTRSEHDATNVECVDSIHSYLKDNKSGHNPKRITCVFEDLDTYAAFKTTEIFKKIRQLNMEFVPYNFYAGWARQVFVQRSYSEKNRSIRLEYPSVYGDGITADDPKYVHLVFVGTSNFSVSFAMEAAHLLHFPNFSTDNNLRTRITFIEENAEKELQLFATRNRHFFDVQPYYYRDVTKGCDKNETPKPQEDLLDMELEKHGFLDVEFEFVKGNVYSADVQKLIKEWAKDTKQYLSFFLAMANQRYNFIMGMNMPDEVYDNDIPVFIRQDRADDFVTNLRETDADLHDKEGNQVKYYKFDNNLQEADRNGRYSKIYPFGMDDMAYFSDENAIKQAKLINYLYYNNFPDTLVLNTRSAKTIWKEANDYWRGLKVADRWSNLYAAYSIRCKLDSLRVMRGLDKDDISNDQMPLSFDEIEQLAAVEHNRWNVEKLLMGYRKAKPYEDRYIHKSYIDNWKSNKKYHYIHSDIRPFGDLDDIKQYDYDIVKYIPWILKMAESIDY